MELNNLKNIVAERKIIDSVKCLAAMLHAPEEFLPGTPEVSLEYRLFQIHQEIDQYLFNGDGNLTYIGKILTLREEGKI
jgi:hypothetical protein